MSDIDRKTLFTVWCKLFKVRAYDYNENEWIVPWESVEKVLAELSDEALTKERTDDTV